MEPTSIRLVHGQILLSQLKLYSQLQARSIFFKVPVLVASSVFPPNSSLAMIYFKCLMVKNCRHWFWQQWMISKSCWQMVNGRKLVLLLAWNLWDHVRSLCKIDLLCPKEREIVPSNMSVYFGCCPILLDCMHSNSAARFYTGMAIFRPPPKWWTLESMLQQSLSCCFFLNLISASTVTAACIFAKLQQRCCAFSIRSRKRLPPPKISHRPRLIPPLL